MSLAPASACRSTPTGDAEFIGAASSLLKALCQVSHVRVLDDAGFAAATADSPVAVVGASRIALARRDRSRRGDSAV
jgi:hypothetical protein